MSAWMTVQRTALMKKIPYITAIALVAFSGGVATFGLAKFTPGSEYIVFVMGALFECGKLTAFTLIHRPLPYLYKTALMSIGLLLMTLNIVGVSGFLSNAYERTQIGAQAAFHAATATAAASVGLVERQLAAAEGNLAAARTAVLKARDDRGRVKAAQAVVATATTERDALVRQLGQANAAKAVAEKDGINASGEFAAIAFISAATGASTDTVAHIAVLTIAAVPDILAVLLLLSAGYKAPKPVRVKVRRRKVPPRKRPAAAVLKIVPQREKQNG
jgi:hypothetical protein